MKKLYLKALSPSILFVTDVVKCGPPSVGIRDPGFRRVLGCFGRGLYLEDPKE